MDIQRLSIYKPQLAGRGSSRTVLQLARGFTNRGLDVDLVLASAKGELKNQIPEEVRIVNFDVDTRLPLTLTVFPKMIKYFKSESPPVMISNTGGANVVPLVARRVTKTDTRIIAKGGVENRKERIEKGDWRGFIMSNLVSWTYPWADKVIMGEQNAANKLINMTPSVKDKTHIIHQPVITSDLLDKANEPVNHPWFNSDDIPVILGVQRLDKPKDSSTLIRAFARFREKRPAHLLILGEGGEREHLESLIKDLGLENSVALPGFVSNPYKYMKSSNLFVLSSKNDTFPNALIEAMACGCPVVATDCPPGGVNTILENGKWGELVPVGEPEPMASAMRRALNGSTEGTKDRANHFSLDRAANSYIEIISEL